MLSIEQGFVILDLLKLFPVVNCHYGLFSVYGLENGYFILICLRIRHHAIITRDFHRKMHV